MSLKVKKHSWGKKPLNQEKAVLLVNDRTIVFRQINDILLFRQNYIYNDM